MQQIDKLHTTMWQTHNFQAPPTFHRLINTYTNF